MVRLEVPPSAFEAWGNSIMWRRNSKVKSSKMILRKFGSFFGTSPQTCSTLWFDLAPFIPLDHQDGAKPVHLLWGLLFLKLYIPADVLSSFSGTTEKTYRKWMWRSVGWISDQSYYKIDLNNRFANDIGNIAKIVVDGVDFRVHECRDEHGKFDKTYFSVKYKHAALKYEIATCIRTGWIVWVNGPFCGGKGDLAIFQEDLKWLLEVGERAHADKGYRHDMLSFFLPVPGVLRRSINSYVRAIHEGINGRLKEFRALSGTWHHSYESHGTAFLAVVVLTQYGLESDRPAAVTDYDESIDLLASDFQLVN